MHRFHHNIETSKEYFPHICTTHTFEDRLEVLGHARSLGLSTCSGGILGMGEGMEDRIKMAMTLREIDVDSVPINFLMPIKGTPFEKINAITPLEALHSIALFRLILPVRRSAFAVGGAQLWTAPSAYFCGRRRWVYDRELSYYVGFGPCRRSQYVAESGTSIFEFYDSRNTIQHPYAGIERRKSCLGSRENYCDGSIDDIVMSLIARANRKAVFSIKLRTIWRVFKTCLSGF